MPDIASIVHIASVWVIPVLVAITFHEAAHGFVAWKLGDDTAFRLGRVTFNPLKHVDLFGTVLLPALLIVTRAPFLFGWAKPVPVDFRRLDSPRRDMVWVAAAGPGINIALALGSAALIHIALMLPPTASRWLIEVLQNSIIINVMLAVFNMLPLPPLDGGRVAVGLLPDALAYPLARLERYGLFILVALIFVVPYLGDMVGMQIDIFAWLVAVPANFVIEVVMTAVGLSN
ncbi:MAG: site-2 protease family protein [Alphaproteobacteria bacterium]